MVNKCFVVSCGNKVQKNCDLKFHKFPKNAALKKKWINALKCKFQPLKRSLVCSDHFLSSDYVISISGLSKTLRRNSIPSRNLGLPLDIAETASERTMRTARRNLLNPRQIDDNTENFECILLEENLDSISVGAEEIVDDEDVESFQENIFQSHEYNDKATQTEHAVPIQCLVKETMLEENLTDERLAYFTGFTRRRLTLLFDCLEISSTKFDNYFSPKNQLILTLIKYKLGIDYILIGELYNISRKVVSAIFSYWTSKMYLYFTSIDFWSMRSQKAGTYTAIVDCTEIYTQQSKNPRVNKELFSPYKNDHTFKYLVAIDENGLVIFCSDVYGGSKSDRQIFAHSKFLDKLGEGNIILADRGFNISDLLEVKKITINIPAFKTGPQFEPEEVMETRTIANRRIHVERVIGLSKKFRILSTAVPVTLWPKVNEIVYNANMLCNFKKSIV